MPENINVRINPISAVKVEVNKQQTSSVRQLNYGIRSLKGSSDLSMVDVTDKDIIVYQANTDSFIVKSVSELNPDLDAGFF